MGVSQSNRRGSRSPRSGAGDESTAAPGEVLFDPTGATVAEVLAHVADHPEDAAGILAAEQAGKARKGIIDALS